MKKISILIINGLITNTSKLTLLEILKHLIGITGLQYERVAGQELDWVAIQEDNCAVTTIQVGEGSKVKCIAKFKDEDMYNASKEFDHMDFEVTDTTGTVEKYTNALSPLQKVYVIAGITPTHKEDFVAMNPGDGGEEDFETDTLIENMFDNEPEFTIENEKDFWKRLSNLPVAVPPFFTSINAIDKFIKITDSVTKSTLTVFLQTLADSGSEPKITSGIYGVDVLLDEHLALVFKFKDGTVVNYDDADFAIKMGILNELVIVNKM